jgi:hypothetical protein
MRPAKFKLVMFAVLLLAPIGVEMRSLRAAPATVVYVAPIEGIIDLGLAPFIERVLRR